MRNKKSLGAILLEMGALDDDQLRAGLGHHRQWGMPLGRSLLELRLCSPDAVVKALSRQTGMLVVDLDQEPFSALTASLLPRKSAEQYRAVPLRTEGQRAEVLVVAIAAPGGLETLDALRAVAGRQRIRPLLASDEAITRALRRLYEPNAVALETPLVSALNQARIHNENEVELEPHNDDVHPEPPPPPSPRPQAPRPVLVVGWKEDATRGLIRLLADRGIPAIEAGCEAFTEAGPDEVVLAPLPRLAASHPDGLKVSCRLVVAGNNPENDLIRAREYGAVGFLAAPLDPDLVVRVVQRVLRSAAEPR